MRTVGRLLAGAALCIALCSGAAAAAIPYLPENASREDAEAWLEAHIEPDGMVLGFVTTRFSEFYDPLSVEKLPSGNLMASFRAELYRPARRAETPFRSARWKSEIDCAVLKYRTSEDVHFAENNLRGRTSPGEADSDWTAPANEGQKDELSQICSLSTLVGSPDQAKALPTPPAEGETVAAWRARAVDETGYVFLSELDGVSTYVAPKEIERDANGHVVAWFRDELARPISVRTTAVRSARTRVEIDCARRQFAFRDYVLYPGANLLGPKYDEFGESPWDAFEPGAQRTRILRALCRLADAPDTPVDEALRQPEAPSPASASPEDVKAWIAGNLDTGLYAFSYADDTAAYFYGTEDLYLLPNGNVTAFLRQERFVAEAGAEPTRSAIYKMEYDCRRNRTRIQGTLRYARANLDGLVYQGGAGGWGRPFAEGSSGYGNLAQICNLRSLLTGEVDLNAALPPPPAAADDAGVIAWLQGYIAPNGYAFGGYSDSAVALYSTQEIERTPQDHIRVWTRTELFEPTSDGVRSMRVLQEFDCDQGRSRVLASELYPGANLLGDKQEEQAETPTWTFNSPGSLGSALANRLCSAGEDEEDDGAISEPLLPDVEELTPL
jgi:hypothetical protein